MDCDPGINKGVKSKKHQAEKFACPYFKYCPSKYKEWRTCPSPGWPDVHRVKEHLYRRHRQPSYRCGRCWESFESEDDYLGHQRTAEPCVLKEKEPIDGFDTNQERKLKQRRIGSDMSETEKWRAIFVILFPNVRPEDIPTPFYDYGQAVNATIPTQPDPVAECEEYILREIPWRLRQIL
ncbi:hypothetical protein F5Y11DRAFT_313199 [Daldinia sp. FL1419]|nr:hypothetical protein F5Y11DRAFT_313199 [Daldinia sp. FL1419]